MLHSVNRRSAPRRSYICKHALAAALEELALSTRVKSAIQQAEQHPAFIYTRCEKRIVGFEVYLEATISLLCAAFRAGEPRHVRVARREASVRFRAKLAICFSHSVDRAPSSLLSGHLVIRSSAPYTSVFSFSTESRVGAVFWSPLPSPCQILYSHSRGLTREPS